MKTFESAVLLTVLQVGLAMSVPALTIRVPVDQSTIQQAIDFANSGDLVLVSPGTYFEQIDYHGKSITVQSDESPAHTIIDGSNNGPVVTFQTNEGPASKLIGFTIQHGNYTFGGGITMLLASPTIRSNIFRDNTGTSAAIDGFISSALIEGNTFLGHSCGTQISEGVVVFESASSPLIFNNVFAWNHCRALNVSLPAGDNPHPVIANNTMIGNDVGVFIDDRAPKSLHLYANNILVENGVGFQMMTYSQSYPPTWLNNLVFNNGRNYDGIADQTGLNGNISLDPMFPSTRSLYDFQLGTGSPAIDAGTLSVPGLPTVDFLGNPRVVDGDGNGSALPDIGAYEFIPQSLAPSEMSLQKSYIRD